MKWMIDSQISRLSFTATWDASECISVFISDAVVLLCVFDYFWMCSSDPIEVSRSRSDHPDILIAGINGASKMETILKQTSILLNYSVLFSYIQDELAELLTSRQLNQEQFEPLISLHI